MQQAIIYRKGNVRYWGGLQEFLQTHHRVALYRGTVKAAKDMPDMTVSYRAFTFCLMRVKNHAPL